MRHGKRVKICRRLVGGERELIEAEFNTTYKNFGVDLSAKSSF
jgi:hypothetical protein